MVASKSHQSYVDIQVRFPETKHIRDVLQHCSYNTLGVFDLDNTVMRPTHEEDLGSDQWFAKVYERAYSVTGDASQAKHLCISLNDTIQKHIQVKPVEASTTRILNILKDVHLPVIALTARSPGLVDITIEQLKKINVFFSPLYSHEIQLDIDDPTRTVIYKNGILFCDGADKGICLAAFLKKIKQTYSVVMVDDNENNLYRVAMSLNKHKIKNTEIHYTHLEQRVSQFQIDRSNMRLSSFTRFFSATEKEAIEKLKLVDEKNLENDRLMP